MCVTKWEDYYYNTERFYTNQILYSVPKIEIQYKHFSLHVMLLIENIQSTTVIAGKGKSM